MFVILRIAWGGGGERGGGGGENRNGKPLCDKRDNNFV